MKNLLLPKGIHNKLILTVTTHLFHTPTDTQVTRVYELYPEVI